MDRKVLALALAAALASAPAAADQYLMEVKVSGVTLGDYVVSYDADTDTYSAPAEVFESIGIPAEKSLPLARLRDYGSLSIDTAAQVVAFDPTDPRLRDRLRPDPERTMIEADRSFLEGKSIDYYLTHSSHGVTSGYLMGTGRLGPADVDLRAGFGGAESYFAAQYHNADNPLVKDVQVGRVQRYGLDGFSISNESRYATASFAEDRVELYWPVGTRVDVYRSGEYLETVSIDQEPFFYDIDLAAATNRFKFEAILPDGTSDTRTFDRSIDGRLVGVGQLSYSLASGSDRNGEDQLYGRVGYGLHEYVSVFVGRDNLDEEYASLLASRDNLTAEMRVMAGDYPGYKFSAGYYGDWVNLNGSVRNAESETSTLSVQLPEIWSSPRYTLTETDTGSTTRKTETFALRKGFRVPGTRLHGNLAPYYKRTEFEFERTVTQPDPSGALASYFETTETETRDLEEYGINALLLSHSGLRFGLSASEVTRSTSDLKTRKIEPEVAFRAWPGRISYRTEFRDDGQGWVNRRHAVNVSVWELDWGTISAGWTSVKGGDQTYTLSISGSFGRDGLSRSPRAYSSEFSVEACEDENLDGICQASEGSVSGVPVHFQHKTHETPVRFTNLSAYRDYEFDVDGVFGYVPTNRHWQTDDLPRGSANQIRVPLRPIEEVEGQIASGKDDVQVGLFDAATGEQIATQKTAFDGWYLFYAPSGKETEVKVIGAAG